MDDDSAYNDNFDSKKNNKDYDPIEKEDDFRMDDLEDRDEEGGVGEEGDDEYDDEEEY